MIVNIIIEGIIMKISTNDYNTLRKGLILLLEENPNINLEYYALGLSKIRCAWDMLFYAINKGYLERDTIQNLHKYLNDAHINTALLSIFKNYYN